MEMSFCIFKGTILKIFPIRKAGVSLCKKKHKYYSQVAAEPAAPVPSSVQRSIFVLVCLLRNVSFRERKVWQHLYVWESTA